MFFFTAFSKEALRGFLFLRKGGVTGGATPKLSQDKLSQDKLSQGKLNKREEASHTRPASLAILFTPKKRERIYLPKRGLTFLF